MYKSNLPGDFVIDQYRTIELGSNAYIEVDLVLKEGAQADLKFDKNNKFQSKFSKELEKRAHSAAQLIYKNLIKNYPNYKFDTAYTRTNPTNYSMFKQVGVTITIKLDKNQIKNLDA